MAETYSDFERSVLRWWPRWRSSVKASVADTFALAEQFIQDKRHDLLDIAVRLNATRRGKRNFHAL